MADTKAELISAATDLGVVVDESWTKADLKAAIDAAQPADPEALDSDGGTDDGEPTTPDSRWELTDDEPEEAPVEDQSPGRGQGSSQSIADQLLRRRGL